MMGVLVALALPLSAQPQEFKWMAVHGGSTFFGDSRYPAQPHYGLSGGWWFSERWGAELRGTRGRLENAGGTLLAHQGIGSASALWKVWPGEFTWQPYLAFGLGSTRNLAYGISEGGLFHSLESRPEFHGGAGVYRRFGERGLLNFDYRAAHTGLRGTQFNDHLLSVGVGMTFGESKPQAAPTPAPPRRLPPPPAAAEPAAKPETAPAQLALAVPAAKPAVRRKAQVKGAIIRFANGQAVLNAKGAATLGQVAQSLKGQPGTYQVKVTGHASKIGPKAFNQRLSLRRAQVAAEHLVAEGLPASAIQIEARGTAEPQADNRTRKGRSLNRRAVVAVKGEPDAVEVQILDTDPVTKKVIKKASKHVTKKSVAKASKQKGKAAAKKNGKRGRR
jgi:OOP family OmpA-OmpF porin